MTVRRDEETCCVERPRQGCLRCLDVRDRRGVWNHSVFSKNRDRLIEHDVVTELFNATVAMAEHRGLLSSS